MSLFKTIKPNLQTEILIWKISETAASLFSEIQLNEKSQTRLRGMKFEMHQRGFLSVRKLLQTAGYTDFDLYYDQSGKPNLVDGKQISISHSHEFAAIIISDNKVGIDLEIQKEKILKIAPKFLNICHLESLTHEDKIEKATVIWGIKEAVFKIKNQKGISFPNHIFESEFCLEDKKATAQLRIENKIENFEIYFETIENYILVYAFEDKNCFNLSKSATSAFQK